MRTLDQAIEALAALRAQQIADFKALPMPRPQRAAAPADRFPPDSRKIVLVAGGHRTGTSATAGLLAQLDLDAGDNLQAGDQHNAKGYFEDRAVVALHDRLLGQLQAAWDDLRPLPEGWLDSPQAGAAADAIATLLVRLGGTNGRIGVIKDPRSCLLLPLWRAVCKESGVTPLFLIPIRTPDASVASLVRRNGLSVEHAALLWLTHLRNAERLSRGCRRDFLHYEALLDAWQPQLARVDRSLGLGLAWDDAHVAAGNAFISAELDHGREANDLSASPALDLARAVHRDLLACVPHSDPAWIFEQAERRIDELVFTCLAAARPASPPQSAPHAVPGPAPTTNPPPAAAPQAITLYPRRLADQQRRQVALQQIAGGDLVGGADILIDLAQAGTDVAEVYHDLGLMALGQSDLVAAKELFATAIAKSPEPGAAHLELARLESREGNFEPALATLSPYLRRAGNDAGALALVREILGLSPELSAIAWARLVADLRTLPPAEANTTPSTP